MALDGHRTTVHIDLTVDSIQVPGGVATIPARLDVQGGGAAAAGTAGAMQDIATQATGLQGALQRLAEILGAETVARLMRLWSALKLLVQAFSALPLKFKILTAAVLTFLVVLRYWRWEVKVLTEMKNKLINALRRLETAALSVVKALFNFVRVPLEFTIRRSLDALRRFHDYLRRYVEEAVRRSLDAIRGFVDFMRDGFRMALDATREWAEESVEQYVDFEQELQNAATVFDQFGENAIAFRRTITEQLVALTQTSRRSALEMAKALYDIGSAGKPAADAMYYLSGAVTLSEATLMDLEKSTEELMATMNKFQIPAEQAGMVVDRMTTAIARSPLDMQKLAAAMKYLGVTAHSFGLSLDQTLAALMGFSSLGYQGSTMGMELAYLLTQLSAQSKKFQTIAKGLGMDITRLQPATHSLVDIVEEFERAQARVGSTAMKVAISQMFGLRSARAMRSLLLVGSRDLREYEEALQATGTAARMQADQLNTLQGALALLRNTAIAARYVFAEHLAPALRTVLSTAHSLLQSAMGAGIFARFGDMLGAAITRALSAVSPLRGAVLVAVVKMLDVVDQALRGVTDAIGILVPNVKNLVEALPTLASDALKSVLPALLGALRQVAPFIVSWVRTVVPLLAELATHFLKFVEALLKVGGSDIIAWFDVLLNAIITVVEFLQEQIPSIVMFVRELTRWLPALLGSLLPLIDRVVYLGLQLAPIWARFLAGMMAVVTSFLAQNGDKLIEWFDTLLTAIRDVANAMLILGPQLQEYLGILIKWVPVIVNLIGSHIPHIAQIFDKLFGNINRGMGAYLAIFDRIVENILNIIEEFAGSGLGQWIDNVTQNLPKLLAFIDDIGRTLRYVVQLFGRLSTNFAPALQMLAQVLGWLAKNLRTILTLMIDLAKARVLQEGWSAFWRLYMAGHPFLASAVARRFWEIHEYLSSLRDTVRGMEAPPYWESQNVNWKMAPPQGQGQVKGAGYSAADHERSHDNQEKRQMLRGTGGIPPTSPSRLGMAKA